MRTRLFASILFLMFSVAASAQGLLTAKAAADLTSISGGSLIDYSGKIGGRLGLSYTHYMSNHWYVEPEANISYNTWKMKELYCSDIDDHIIDNHFRNISLNIPVMFGYSIPVGAQHINIYMGPQVSYNLCNKWVIDDKLSKDEFDDNALNTDYNKFTFSLKAGVGVVIDDYTVAIEGAMGLNEMYKDSSNTYKNVFSLVLGYSF